MDEPQPNQVVTPGESTPSSHEDDAVTSAVTTPVSIENPAPVIPSTPSFQQVADAASPVSPTHESLNAVQWTASEYVAHEKNSTWYGALTLGGIILAIITYMMTRDFVSAVVVIVAIAGLAYFASRSPQTQSYVLDGNGIRVGQKLYPFSEFKSFAMSEEGPIASIILMPLKRFMPPLTIYVDPAQEAQVTHFLAQYLAAEVHKPDAVDKLVSRIRF